MVLDRETFERLIAQLIDADRIFALNPTLRFMLSGAEVEIAISEFSKIVIERRHAANDDDEGQARAGGADFRYTYTGGNEQLNEYIKRVEIGADNKVYSCFVYALRMAGVDVDTCNRINARCFTRYLRCKDVQRLVDEFKLNVEVKLYSWNAKDLRQYDHVVKPSGKSPIRISLWKQHYFVHEDTPFTDADFGVSLRAPESPKAGEPLPLSSTRLLMLLFDLGLMRRMFVSELPHSIVAEDYKSLDYNPKFCLQKQALKDLKTENAKHWHNFVNQCLRQVPAVSGVVKSFMTRAAHGGRLLERQGVYDFPVSLLDFNSLYPYALSRLEIPTGAPIVWDDSMNLFSYR
jgi:hypothetical protein